MVPDIAGEWVSDDTLKSRDYALAHQDGLANWKM